MSRLPGRSVRARDGKHRRQTTINVDDETLAIFDAAAEAWGKTRSEVIEHFARNTPLDERGLPLWFTETKRAEQLSLAVL